MPMTVEEILARAKEAGASDVHITVGIPPEDESERRFAHNGSETD